MKIDFSKKIVLVTGATRGIGQKIAADFEALGAQMLLTGTKIAEIDRLNRQAKKEKAKRKYLYADFSSRESLDDLIMQLSNHPRIDVLVNNAGINYLNLIMDARESDWDQMMDVNMRAPYFLMKAVSLKMKKFRYGRIVNISSIMGYVARPKRSIYTATKSAIVGMTKSAAIEFAEHNILVNAVSPGFIMTDLTRKNLSPNERKDAVRQIPLRRFGSVDDISCFVIFLASDLNTYMTGQNLIVDGGFVSV